MSRQRHLMLAYSRNDGGADGRRLSPGEKKPVTLPRMRCLEQPLKHLMAIDRDVCLICNRTSQQLAELSARYCEGWRHG